MSPSGPTTFCQGGSVVLTSSAGISYSWSTGETAQSITVSSSGSYTVTVTDESGCLATSAPISITVNPLPVASITPSGPTTFCQGGSVNLTSSAGSNFLWSTGETTQSVTVTASGSYSVTVTDANECLATSAITTVEVNIVTPGTINSDQTICSSGDPLTFASITPGTGSGAITYRWESSVDPFTSWTTVAGANTETYDVPPGVTATTEYRRITVSTLNGIDCESVPAAFVTVTVQSLPDAGAIAGNQTICNGGDPAAFTGTTPGTGNGTITYRWESSVDPFTTWTTIPGASTATYNVPPGLSATTEYRRVTISTLNAIACESAPASFVTVTVQNPTAGVIGGNQTICYGGDPAAFAGITPGTGSGIINYRWERSVSPFTNWTIVTGATAEIYDAPSGLTATTQYRRFTISTLNGIICESAPAAFVTVTVQSVPTAGAIAGNQTRCSGGDPAAFTSTTPGTGNGTITYRWESSASPFTAWNTIPGVLTETYDAPSGLSATTEFRRITVSILNGTSCESSPTSFVTVTVQSIPTAGVIAGNQTICNGGDPAVFTSTTPGTGSGSISYRWESSVNPFTGWNTVAGVTTATYNVPSGLTATTRYRRITISTLNGILCESAPAAFVTVTVQAIPTAGVIAGNQTICNGVDPAAFTETLPASGDGNLTYQWQSNTTGCGSGFANIAGAINPIYDPSSLSVTTYYRRIVTSTLNGVACNSISNCITVTVNALPSVNSISGPSSVCTGNNITLTNSTQGGVWSSSNTGIATIGNTGVVTGISGGVVTISYSVTNGNGCTRTVNTTVTVNSTTVTIAPAGPTTFCRGGSVTLTASGANTYSWSPVDGLSITTGPTVIAAPEVTTTYLVTGNGATGCTGTAQVTVTVNQRPEGIMSSDPAVCSGLNSGTVSLTVADGSTVLGWESSINGGTNWFPYSPTTDQYTTTYLNLTQTTVYRALLQLNGCQSYSSIGIIPVNNVLKPVVTVSSSISCLNTAVILTASGYGQPPFPVEDFQSANPAGWSGDDAAANNEDPNSNWALTTNGKTFNGRPYNSQASPTNSKFIIVTGITDEADHNASITAPPFSLVGTINPILSFYTALNFNAGTSGIVQISTDGGITFTDLITYTGPREYGNPDNGWRNVTYSLAAYINQPDVRVRFNYTGTAGSNWGLDNIGIISTFQPIAYHWTPLDHMTPSTGDTPSVTILPDVGLHQYCVSSTTAAGCESDTVCVTVNVLPLPVCSITGNDGPVCPSSANSFTAPPGMSRYAWGITGNGRITAGATSQNVTVTSGTGCNLPFTLSITITDTNGCVSTCNKTVLVQDITAPTIICPVVSAQYRMDNGMNYYSAVGTEFNATAIDNCTISSITHNLPYSSNTTLSGYHFPLGSTTVTWTATDACGLSSTCQIIITVIDDQPPAITCPPPINIQCASDVPAPYINYAAFAAAGGVATDNNQIDPALFSISGTDVIANQSCANRYTITRTYQIADLSGNSATCTQTITVDDRTAPVITGCPADHVFCETQDNTFSIPATLAATDNCRGAINISYEITGTTTRNGLGNDASGIFNNGISIITWSATDACGNVSTCTTTITINPLPRTSPIYHR